jgi:HNH endonuclease
MLTTLAQFSVEEILPILGLGKDKAHIRLSGGEEFDIKVGTPRLECLRRNQECVWCRRAGNVFLLQRHGVDSPHLNLFSEKGGNLLLMTQDHIIPQSRGGISEPDNLQTMCTKCNNLKGSDLNLEFVLKMTGGLFQQPVKFVPPVDREQYSLLTSTEKSRWQKTLQALQKGEALKDSSANLLSFLSREDAIQFAQARIRVLEHTR